METGITNMGRASTVKIKHKIKEQALPKMQWRQFKKNNFKVFIENIQNPLNTI
jgi:hypothetical protein